MAKVTAGEVIKRRTYTIRPFAGRNSETEAMSIESNQAASGTNFRIERGILRRRPSFSRIGGRMDRLSWNGTASTYNRIHQILTKRVGELYQVRLVGEGGVYNLWPPDTSMTSGSIYPEPPLRSSYSAGTVALTSTSPTVTGTGTAWQTRGVHPGASFVLGSTTYTVRSVNSETSLLLTSNSSTTTSGAAYRMSLYGASDRSVQNANRHVGVYPDPFRLAVGDVGATPSGSATQFSVSGGTTLSANAYTSSLSTTPTTLTAGSLIHSTQSDGLAGSWLRIVSDAVGSAEELSGKTPISSRRLYRHMGRTTGGLQILSERWRRSTGTYLTGGASPYRHFTTGMTFAQNADYTDCRIWDTIGPGTVTVTTGGTTVAGIGTSFGAGGGVVAGDEIVLNHRRYRIASVGSATSITLAAPFDNATVSGGSYGTIAWRSIVRTNAGVDTTALQNVTETLQAGTLGAAVPNGRVHADLFPRFRSASSSSAMDYRIQTALGEMPNPYWVYSETYQNPADRAREMYLFVCAGDVAENVRHNIWWDAMPNKIDYESDVNEPYVITGELMPVSMIAPNAKLIEWWNGRLFAAGLMEVNLSSGSVTADYAYNEVAFENPLGLAWTRVNEPFSWWNQYATDGAGDDIVTNGSGAIKALKVLSSQNVMAVYREHGITVYYPTGDAINPFGSTYRDLGSGPVSDDAILEVPDGHLFLALDGHIKIFNGSTMADFPCSVLDYIRDNMTWAQAHWVQAVWEKNKNEYMWFIPTTTAQALTAAVVYNTTYGVWYVYEFEDTPLSCAAYIDTAEHTSERRIWAVTNDCHLVAFRDEAQGGLGFDFIASVGGGTGFSGTWESKDFALPIPETDSETRLKLVDSVELLYDSDPDFGGTVTVSVSPDGGETWTSFGNVSLRPGTVTGTRSTLAGGAQVNAVNHRVRIVQTPSNFNVEHSMAVKAVKIHYVDFGEATP